MKTDREVTGFPEGFFEYDPDISFGNKPTFLSPDDPITRSTFIRINPPGRECENLVLHIASIRTTIRAAIEHVLAREFERTDPNISPVIGLVAGYFVRKPIPGDTLSYLRVDAEVRGVRRLSEPRNIPHKPEPPQKRRRHENPKERRAKTSPTDRISLIREAAKKAAIAREK